MLLMLLACGGESEDDGPADITVAVSPVSFGVLEIGGSVYHDMQISNTGGELLTLDAIRVVGDTSCFFTFDGPDATDIAGGTSAFLRVTYSPTRAGDDHIQVEIDSNADSFSTLVVPMCGTTVDKGTSKGVEAVACEIPAGGNCSANEIVL